MKYQKRRKTDNTLSFQFKELIKEVKAMVFPVVMYSCEDCTIKKTEYQRINAFKLWSGEDS